MKYVRNCPKCNTIISYGRSDSLKSAIERNIQCRSCAQKSRKPPKSIYADKIKIGDKFGLWDVVGDVIKNGGTVKTKCKCGFTTNTRIDRLLSGRTSGCRSCTMVGKNSSNWKGCGDIPATVINKILRRANKLEYECNIDTEYLNELYIIQDKKCALSGIAIDFIPKSGKIVKGDMTASLDRISSNIGYVKGNVQWVYTKINMMKQAYTQEDFLELCKIITDYNENRII